MEEERRKSARIKKVLVVRYGYGIDKDGKKWDVTAIRDIGDRGMQIATIKHFNNGEVLNFVIKIPFKPFQWIEFDGKIVGSEELKTPLDHSVAGTYLTRVEFLDLKEDLKELLHAYVDWFLSQRGGER